MSLCRLHTWGGRFNYSRFDPTRNKRIAAGTAYLPARDQHDLNYSGMQTPRSCPVDDPGGRFVKERQQHFGILDGAFGVAVDG